MRKMLEYYEIFVDGKRKAGFLEGESSRDNSPMDYHNFKKEFEEYVNTWKAKGINPIRMTYTIKLICADGSRKEYETI